MCGPMPPRDTYHPDPRFQQLGAAFADPVQPATFPLRLERFFNHRWAAEIGLDRLDAAAREAHFARFAPLAGNMAEPLAMRYHGHQFRVYNPDIGDGRGFLFGQLRDSHGRLLDLASKGSGQTPYSRRGDGRLTLKGGVREVLAAAMLEAQGVYTSKALALFETGEALERNDEPSPTWRLPGSMRPSRLRRQLAFCRPLRSARSDTAQTACSFSPGGVRARLTASTAAALRASANTANAAARPKATVHSV